MKQYVIYSEELKGFIPENGEELTSDITSAKVFSNIGDAMRNASEAMRETKAIFKLHEL